MSAVTYSHSCDGCLRAIDKPGKCTRCQMEAELTLAQRRMVDAVRAYDSGAGVERWRFMQLCGRQWFRVFESLLSSSILERAPDDAHGVERYVLAPGWKR